MEADSAGWWLNVKMGKEKRCKVTEEQRGKGKMSKISHRVHREHREKGRE